MRKLQSLEGTIGTEIRSLIAEVNEVIEENLIKLSDNPKIKWIRKEVILLWKWWKL